MSLKLSDLFEKYADSVFRAAYKITGNREDALDVTQDIFLKLKDSDRSITQIENIKAYLIRMSVNSSLNFKRKETSQIEMITDQHQINTATDIEETIRFKKNTIALKLALENISEKQREAVTHRFFSEMTIEEVADVMNITVSSVRVHLVRALKQLRTLLNNKLNKELL